MLWAKSIVLPRRHEAAMRRHALEDRVRLRGSLLRKLCGRFSGVRNCNPQLSSLLARTGMFASMYLSWCAIVYAADHANLCLVHWPIALVERDAGRPDELHSDAHLNRPTIGLR